MCGCQRLVGCVGVRRLVGWVSEACRACGCRRLVGCVWVSKACRVCVSEACRVGVGVKGL